MKGYLRFMSNWEIISVREKPEYIEDATAYIKSRWLLDDRIYEDCILNSINNSSTLPRWYILVEDERIIGSYGIIMNDFISRQDIWPWFAALYIEESERGRGLGSVLLEHGRREAGKIGYEKLYLCTDHIGFYEKYGWTKIGKGYHPWHEESSIYMAPVL